MRVPILLIFIFVSYSVFSHSISFAKRQEYKTYKGYKILGFENSGENAQNLLKQIIELDSSLIAKETKKNVEILIAPELLDVFYAIAKEKNVKTKILVKDFSRLIEAERTENRIALKSEEGFSWNAYYDVDDIYAYLKNVSKTYPDWAQLVKGGKSYEGRPILGLKINTTTRKKSNESKPIMFIESGIHAREWITPATTTYFINQLFTSNDEEIIKIRDEFEWHIFPTVNPDGYHYTFTTDRMWRKTRSQSSKTCYGADPNRNWDYNWLRHGASNDPCDYQTYGGRSPFSEKETRSLSSYISKLENLLGYVAFHADAQMLLLPYSDSKKHIDNYDDLVQIGKTSLEYGYKVNGEGYEGPATAAEILYKASGGSMDWVRSALGTPLVYTYELRGIYFQWPPHRIPEQGEEVTQMILGLLSEAKNLGYYR